MKQKWGFGISLGAGCELGGTELPKPTASAGPPVRWSECRVQLWPGLTGL